MEYIRKQTLPEVACAPSGGYRSLPLLPGEIPGVETEAVVIAASGSFVMEPVADEQAVLFVMAGDGVIRHNARDFPFGALAVFIPAEGRATVAAARAGATLLLMRMKLKEEDKIFMRERSSARPYTLRYEDAAPYSEAIKSAKTVSRTLVNEDVIPRFAMGSVETTGPDEVGAHEHPMLEQLFLGLPGNRCRVAANGQETVFDGQTLLHIPLASRHSVRVDPGDSLRYIWMDFFMRQEGTAFIAQAHVRQNV